MVRRVRPEPQSAPQEPTSRALRAAAERGLNLDPPPRDAEGPTLPDDLTELTSDHLGGLLAALTTWWSYARGQQALAQIAENQARHDLRSAQSRAAAAAKSEKTVAAQKAVAADDPAVHAADQEVEDATALRIVLDAVVEGYEFKARTASRELTRRGALRDVESRAGKWAA